MPERFSDNLFCINEHIKLLLWAGALSVHLIAGRSAFLDKASSKKI